jgi:hypothetical protein
VTEEIVEIWRTCPENDHYEVSNLGRVRRFLRSRPERPYKYLKLAPDKYGYMTVGLSRNDVSKHHKVHQLVMSAFVGPRPEGYQVNHKDHVKNNNVLSNLEYVTPSENTIHAYSCPAIRATIAREFQRRDCKLSDEQVRDLRREYASGLYAQKDLAIRYGISIGHLSYILRNKRRVLAGQHEVI